jgi:cell division protein FtsI/penicillin-binding protein 2
MLADSIEAGEGSQALVPGYRIAGKTGTAEIPTPGGYHPTDSIGSFIGWGPVDDPQFIVLVKLDRPSSSIWGSETAAPVFSQLVQRLVVLLEIPPDDVRQALQAGN